MGLNRGILASVRVWGLDLALTMSLFLLFFSVGSNLLVYGIITIPTIISSIISTRKYFKDKKLKKTYAEIINISILFLFSGIIPYLFYGVLLKLIIPFKTIIIKISIATIIPITLKWLKKI